MNEKDIQVIKQMYWGLFDGLEAALNVYEEEHKLVQNIQTAIKEAEETYSWLTQ